MKTVKIVILISCLLSVLTCSAKKYQIKVLNTPTITIDKKEAKVGDWFDEQSVIVWSKDNQAMRVVSEDNKVYTLSAKLYKEAKAKKFSDFIIYTKPLAARGTKDLDLIEQLAERFDQDFIMLDEIVIDLSDINLPSSIQFVLSNVTEYRRIGCKFEDGNLIISRNDINQIAEEDAGTVSLQILLRNSSDFINISDLAVEFIPLYPTDNK